MTIDGRRSIVYGGRDEPLDARLPPDPGVSGRPVVWRGVRLVPGPAPMGPWFSTEAMLRVLRWVAGTLPPRTVVIDVGCGTGVLGLYVALRRPGTTAVLVDVRGDAVDNARLNVDANRAALGRRASSAHVVQGDTLTAVRPPSRPTVVVANLPFDPSPAPSGTRDLWGRRAAAFRDAGYAAHRRLIACTADELAGPLLLATSPTIGDTGAIDGMVTAAGLQAMQRTTFWFRTPRRRAPDAMNAYTVLLVTRRGRASIPFGSL